MIYLVNVAHAGVISDAPSISQVGMNILSFLLSVVGIIAIIALVVAGVMYLTAAGDERRMENGKKYFQYSLLGIILAMSGMVLVGLIGQFFK